MNTKGTLYLIATPIGNYEDITYRGARILSEVDVIICEEFKEAKRLLNYLKINKELTSLNEHNEKDEAQEIIINLKAGKNYALISDCGTPLFSDPGHYLVDLCIASNIKIVPVPGTSSLLPALISSGFDFEKFYYYGWLSPKKEIRKQQLLKLKNIKEVIVLLDTPYRLKQLVDDVSKFIGKNIKVVVAYNITMPDEEFIRGSAEKVLQTITTRNLKGEFVLMVDNKINKNRF